MKPAVIRQEPAASLQTARALPEEDRPIGIFDSGIGGLTVVREVMKILPNERIIYLGDTARVPYGTKSDRTIKAFTLQSCLFLLEHDVKMIIIACNTASAVALDFIANMFRIPVIGVIKPGSAAAASKTNTRRVGIIGTQTTINSHSYTRTLQSLNAQIEVFAQPCSLFVPIAEEGWLEHDVTMRVAEEYLKVFADTRIDTLVMGCTHYPILASAIQKTIDHVMGQHVHLIDSGIETAKQAKAILKESLLLNRSQSRTSNRFYVTDLPKNFSRVGQMFLGSAVDHVETVNVEIMGM
ncbi:MAG: glutamate racemase [Bacteroidetes bacterium]|nr:glutamate racemase [Bacteroidota bacterium]